MKGLFIGINVPTGLLGGFLYNIPWHPQQAEFITVLGSGQWKIAYHYPDHFTPLKIGNHFGWCLYRTRSYRPNRVDVLGRIQTDFNILGGVEWVGLVEVREWYGWSRRCRGRWHSWRQDGWARIKDRMSVIAKKSTLYFCLDDFVTHWVSIPKFEEPKFSLKTWYTLDHVFSRKGDKRMITASLPVFCTLWPTVVSYYIRKGKKGYKKRRL